MAVFAVVAWVVVTGGPWASGPPTPAGPTGSTPTRTAVRPSPPASTTPAPVGTTLTAEATRVGFIGLPPKGARPSTPETGELVLSFSGWPTPTGFLHRAWLYADGRLIWLRHGDLPEGANRHLTGFLEQRLTPEGVELFRSQVLSRTVLHDAPSPEPGEPFPSYIEVEVRTGGRLVRLDRPSDVGGLIALFMDPASWLPPGAWEEPEAAAYVPSRYAVCSETAPAGSTLASAGLPASIVASLDASELGELPGELAAADGGVVRCSRVTTDDARAIADALERAGFRRDGAEAHRLAYRLDVSEPIRTSVSIWFEPYLPHDEPIDSSSSERRA